MKKLLLALITVTGAASLHGMEPQKQLSPISLAQTFHQFLHSEPALPQDVTQQIFSFQFKAHLTDLEKSCSHPCVLIKCIETLLESCGYELASELCKHYFSQAKKSMCDIKNKFSGKTALHSVAFNDQTEIAKLLLNTAGNNAWTLLTIQMDGGETALHIAAFHRCTEVAKLLLNTAGDNAWTLLTIRNKKGATALHQAACGNHTEIVKLILNAAGDNAWTLLSVRDKKGYTALHTAACYNSAEVVELLLDAAGDNAWELLTIRDKYGKTAFDIAKPKVKEVMQPYLHKNNQ